MRDFLAYAAAKHEAGQPIISDEAYDRLAKQYNFEAIGAAVDITRAVPHAHRMYSLKKCFVGEPLIKLPSEDIVETPKLDGSAISALYVEGKFQLGLRRGDGIRGDDITDKVRTLVPAILQGDIKTPYQITGEALAFKNVENARNVAAGAFSLGSLAEFRRRNLTFIAYGITPSPCGTFREDMKFLRDRGFQTVDESEWPEFPQDGRVFRVNDNALFEELGYTGKHPRGAFALKEIQDGVITTLLDVEWQVGRTGVVAPVAILKPIKVGDATVQRANLHNIKYINELGLEIGCLVEIIRSGEIIPRVTRRIEDANTTSV